jgi:hypothetical protein
VNAQARSHSQMDGRFAKATLNKGSSGVGFGLLHYTNPMLADFVAKVVDGFREQ